MRFLAVALEEDKMLINRMVNAIYWVKTVYRYRMWKDEDAFRSILRIGPPFNNNKKYLCLLGTMLLQRKDPEAAMSVFASSISCGWISNKNDEKYLDLYANAYIRLIDNEPISRELERDIGICHVLTKHRTQVLFPPPKNVLPREEAL